MRRSSNRVAWVGPLLILLIGAGCGVVIVLNGATGEGSELALAAAMFTLVGALILYRTEGNRVGWVMAAIGISLFASGVSELADETNAIALAVGGGLWLSWFVLLGLLAYWYPSGRPVTPRWRFLGWLAAPLVLITASYVVADELCLEESGLEGECAVWVDNPIGIEGVPNPEYGDLSTVGYMALIVFVVLSAASLVVRFIRARGVERLQMKWFAFAVVSLILATVAQETLAGIAPVPTVVWDVLWGIAVLGLPVAIGVSVLRYRLYEIDRIVSRSVTYLLVLGLLAAVYVGCFLLLTQMFPLDNDLVVAASTLGVAALFNPVRNRIRSAVDRRFNRSRFNIEKVMDDFSGSLQGNVDTAGLIDGWLGVVSETMQPATVGVWIRPG